VSQDTSSLFAAGLGLMLNFGTVPLVTAATDDGCPQPPCANTTGEGAMRAYQAKIAPR